MNQAMIWCPNYFGHLRTVKAEGQMIHVVDYEDEIATSGSPLPETPIKTTTKTLWLETLAVRDPNGNLWTIRVFVNHLDRDDCEAWAEEVFNPEAFKALGR